MTLKEQLSELLSASRKENDFRILKDLKESVYLLALNNVLDEIEADKAYVKLISLTKDWLEKNPRQKVVFSEPEDEERSCCNCVYGDPDEDPDGRVCDGCFDLSNWTWRDF